MTEAAQLQNIEMGIFCRGNVGRSVAGMLLMRQKAEKLNQEFAELGMPDRIIIVSAGTQGTAVDPKPVRYPNIGHYSPMHEYARPVLERLGIYAGMLAHTSQPATEALVDRCSLLFAVDERTDADLRVLFPGHTHKIHLLSRLIGGTSGIPDPEGADSPERQERIFTFIHRTIDQGFSVAFELRPELVELSDRLKDEAPKQILQPADQQAMWERIMARTAHDVQWELLTEK